MASEGLFDPASLRVLLLDGGDDTTGNSSLEAVIRQFNHQVTICKEENEALLALQDKKAKFHLLIVDINLNKHDVNNFELFKRIGSESNIPVILISEHAETDVVVKCLDQGASYFLAKPISEQDIKYIWQHAFVHQRSDQEKLLLGQQPQTKTIMAKQPMTTCNKKVKCEEGFEKGRESKSSRAKKPRVMWAGELDEKFNEALDRLDGISTPPNKIHEYMKNTCAHRVSDLTRENIASHLQKVRLQSEKVNGGSWHDLKRRLPLPNNNPQTTKKFKQPCSSSPSVPSGSFANTKLIEPLMQMREKGYGFGSTKPVLLPMQAQNVNFQGGFPGFYRKIPNHDHRQVGVHDFHGEASSFPNLLNPVPAAGQQNLMVPNEFGRVVVSENMVPLQWSSNVPPTSEDVYVMKPQTNQTITQLSYDSLLSDTNGSEYSHQQEQLMQTDENEQPLQDSNTNWYL